MNTYLTFLSQGIITQTAIEEVMHCNDLTSRYGLVLSESDTREIVEVRGQLLSSYDRIELGGGMINKLIKAFCDSPYINQGDYCDILQQLMETFYYFKNECLDQLSDDELIERMKDYFDHYCHGSLELLQNRELEQLTRNIRYEREDYENLDLEDALYLGEDYE